MKIAYYEQYIEAVKGCSPAQKMAVIEALERFVLNPRHPLLKQKNFGGKLEGYGSVQASPHFLMIYRMVGSNQYAWIDCVRF